MATDVDRKKIPDDVKFIGIHAHALEPQFDSGENIFPFEIVSVVEEPLNFVVTLRTDKFFCGRFAGNKTVIIFYFTLLL